MIVLLLAACDPTSPLVLDAWTSGGTWHVAADTPLQALATDLALAVDDGDEAPATGLTVEATVRMPDMTHVTGPVSLAEHAPGTYEDTVFLAMPGLYVLTGDVADDAGAEAFTLVVDVR